VSVNSRWPAASLPPYAPGITGSAPISQAASASDSVFEAIEYVASAVLALCGSPAAGSAGIGARKGADRGHWPEIGPPSIHVRTDWSAHPDGSAVTVLWPTPGTMSSWPCGKRETTARAPSVGVRMSKPPLTASMGTSGSGPVASDAPPAGLGQPTQKSAFPKRYAQLPKGPNVPAGSAATAEFRIAWRPSTGVSGDHGKGPSRQTVAA